MKLNRENVDNKVIEDLDNRNLNWSSIEEEFKNVSENQVQEIENARKNIERSISSEIDNLNKKYIDVNRVLGKYSTVNNNLNVNQEEKQQVGGSRVIGLPKTAGEGQGQFSMRGLTATNLVRNGNFKSGLDAWSGYSSEKTSVIDGKMVHESTGGGYYNIARQDIKINKGDIIYVKGYNSLGRTLIYDLADGELRGSYFQLERGNYDFLSATYVVGSDMGDEPYGVFEGVRIYLNSNQDQLKGKIKFWNFSAYNLTEVFGAGNEPSKEECDIIFTNYFEGKKSVNGSVRIKSLGKNLFDKERGFHYGYHINSEGKLAESSNFVSTPYIGVVGGETYTSSKGTSGWPGSKAAFYNSDYEVINVTQTTNVSLFEAPENAKYFRMSMSYSEGLSDTFQIELGTENTSYESFSESVLYIEAPKLRSNPDGVADEIKDGKLYRRINDEGETMSSTEITPLKSAGNLVVYPLGTIIIEDVISDITTYTDRITTKHKISEIDKIILIDFDTGNERNLNVDNAEIHEDSLSFTHPEITTGDIVLFDYYYEEDSIDGISYVEFYDSRYTIKDSITNKVYRWNISIADGVPNIVLEEI